MMTHDAYSELLEDLGPVKLIAVSKRQELQKIEALYSYGHRDFGENLVQPLLQRAEDLPKDIRWHLIGPLQSNKVKYIAPFVHLVHSVDRWKIVKGLNKEARKNERVIDFLFQIKIAEEDSKSGYDPAQLKTDLRTNGLEDCSHLRCRGVMGMSTLTDDQDQVRSEFANLKNHFLALKEEFFADSEDFTEISMGMSGDYPMAIEEGSTMVRIGSKVFGPRTY